MQKQLYAGIDLHSNNLVVAIVDQSGKRMNHRRLPCSLSQVLEYFEEKASGEIKEIAVESTYNWYWLVDGLKEAGYHVKLANPAGMKQYNGLKSADDKTDAYFIAELMRLGILPCGTILEPPARAARDLLRRRQLLVSKRTALILALKNQYIRTHGKTLPLAQLKSSKPEEMAALFQNCHEQLAAEITKDEIEHLDDNIKRIEKACWQQAQKFRGYENLNTLPGIGRVLSGVITLETADITRFASPENYASYCRTVAAKRTSNGKSKGENNAKCGNKYLAWAFIEAANLARRYDENARRWFDRKAAKKGNIIATKALACKMSKAAWHLMRSGGSYDPERLFGVT
ncbi:MAG: IS110 family transposase [Verrucomicrobiae bacterium]|nr:IS110 family transposase [Verrucomicrobiae bacterium]NNJ86207.1 IS110 family transposase [Akkermansiaceae bacterium]